MPIAPLFAAILNWPVRWLVSWYCKCAWTCTSQGNSYQRDRAPLRCPSSPDIRHLPEGPSAVKMPLISRHLPEGPSAISHSRMPLISGHLPSAVKMPLFSRYVPEGPSARCRGDGTGGQEGVTPPPPKVEGYYSNNYVYILCIKLVGIYLTDFAPPPKTESPSVTPEMPLEHLQTRTGGTERRQDAPRASPDTYRRDPARSRWPDTYRRDPASSATPRWQHAIHTSRHGA
jgi:hypothetical protein